MKEVKYISLEPLSDKVKEKLRKMSENQKNYLEQIKKDYENGKFDDIISKL